MIVRPRKLYEQIADHIADAIYSHQYGAGDRLPAERELMEQYGVGRPAVREAIFSLERLGLLEVRSGQRARVTKPSPEKLIGTLSGAAKHYLVDDAGVRYFQDARMFFEVGIARHAAREATPEDIDNLKEALLANKRAIGTVENFVKTDVNFHFVLVLITRNPIFSAVHDALVEWLTEQRHTALNNPHEDTIAYGAHEAIYEAIAAHDPDRAEREMRSHLCQVAEAYWRAGRQRDGARP